MHSSISRVHDCLLDNKRCVHGVHQEMKKTFFAGALLLPLLACNNAAKPTPENFLKALNTYLPDHKECLLDGSIKFPYETSDPAVMKQMDALVKAQMLESHRAEVIKVTVYSLTPSGVKAGHNLCYGHREATAIVSSTPPAPANGFTETQVVYRYSIMDQPVWAKTPEVVAAFPKMAREVSGDATATQALALTRVWTVPD